MCHMEDLVTKDLTGIRISSLNGGVGPTVNRLELLTVVILPFFQSHYFVGEDYIYIKLYIVIIYQPIAIPDTCLRVEVYYCTIEF